jgi:CelD/BcsL family acetyltransferase involved in cellulose biosynthesis
MARIQTHVLTNFADPRCGPDLWATLLCRGNTDDPALSWHWLRAWWETLGQGSLLLIAVERAGEVAALAPLYVHEGIVFFLGVGESDYLDFIGDVGEPGVLTTLLATAREAAPEFLGIRLHFVPENSRTGLGLQEAASQLGFSCLQEEVSPAVEVDLAGQREAIEQALQRSMLKREEYFRRGGPLEVTHMRDSQAIRPHLEAFYAQHVKRWQAKGIASQYVDPDHRAFLERFLEIAATTGWIRFLRIDWQGRPLAFEFAWYYNGRHVSAPWSFAIEEAKYSPGHVLLRQSLRAALAEGLHTYDLGRGDQQYKFRLPGRVKHCITWGLYPP